MIAITLIVAAYLLRAELREAKAVTQYGVALLLGGAIGNLIDRIILGKVVDFFDFMIWPIFNIADIVINAGVGMLIVEMIWEPHEERAHESSEN